MVSLYAVATVLGLTGLTGWVLARTLATARGSGFDPELRYGRRGRRAVAAVTGFGLGGMSASYSPLSPGPLLGLVAAVLGAALAAWYAGWIGTGED